MFTSKRGKDVNIDDLYEPLIPSEEKSGTEEKKPGEFSRSYTNLNKQLSKGLEPIQENHMKKEEDI